MEREYDEPIYPEGYQVKAVIYSHDYPDQCFTIEKYSGIHSDEYLECYRVDGQKTGIGTLFKNGKRILQCCFSCNIINGWGTIYNNGFPIVEVLWKNNEVIKTVILSHIENGRWIDERKADGSLVYTGEYDHCTFDKDGYGIIYNQNEKEIYGLFEQNEMVHICKTFVKDEMTEYNDYNATTYIGHYKDRLDLNYPREGEGKEYELQKLIYEGNYQNNERNGFGISYYENGIASFKGIWKNNKEFEGSFLPEIAVMKEVSNQGEYKLTAENILTIDMYSSIITSITIADNTCNEESSCELVLTDLPSLTSIHIGKQCCSYIRFFSITNLPNLESLRIERDSFTLCNHADNAPQRNHHEERILRENRCCSIINCPSLQQCIMDVGCFSDYLHFILESIFK